MQLQTWSKSLTNLATAGALTVAALFAGPAQANLTSPVQVSLLSPGGLIINTVPNTFDATPIALVQPGVSTGVGINAGDGTDIGGMMLSGEYIHFSGNSILLHVAAGAVNDSKQIVAGYLGLGAQHARYVFDNLAVAGQTIIGANIFTTGGDIVGTATGGLTAPGEFSFNLDDLVFVDPGTGNSNAFGEFRIDLLLQADNGGGNNVPETASLGLALLALAALQWRGRPAKA